MNSVNADASAAAAAKQTAQDAVTRAQSAVSAETQLLTDARAEAAKIEKMNPRDVQRLTLGVPVYYYEFSDLFRDDKNPSAMDLMKFQMFGWTLVAIFIYAWLFLEGATVISARCRSSRNQS